jgi:hypothetical protein
MNPVSGVNILIERIDSSYSDNQTTDSSGRSVISGLSEAIKKYRITLSKSGYETVSTELPFSDGGTYNPPIFEHASVVALSLNTIDLYQNKLADLTVRTEDYLGNFVANINYHIQGGREIGKKASDGTTPVYTLNADDQTDSGGEKIYQNISPGKITFELSEIGYEIIGASRPLTFDLAPDENANFAVRISPNSATSLLFFVKNDVGGSVVSGASVRLTNSGGYDATVSTDPNGWAFFPKEESAPLSPGETYDFSINAGGFDEVTGQVTIEAGIIKDQEVLLTPSA